MASAVILDLDGTVWDSHPFYAAAVGGSSAAKEKRALAELKAEGPAATMLRNSGVSKGTFRALCRADRSLVLYPDARPTLSALVERGVALGAVTNLPAWMVEPMLECQGLADLLDSVVPYGRATRNKPAPDPLLYCCRELDVDADSACWYVGDSGGDCTAAQRAGLSFAWASWGYFEQPPRGSDVTLSGFADIANL